MGLIFELEEFVRDEVEGTPIPTVKGDPGGGDNLTAEHYQPSGYDAQPLPGDFYVTISDAGTGRVIATGWLDPVNEGTAAPGEARMYSRDSEGAISVTLRLANDGFVHLAEDVAEALIARADRVEAELDKLKTAHNDHTHLHDVCAGGTTAVGTLAGTSDTPDLTYTPDAVGCDKVKGT